MDDDVDDDDFFDAVDDDEKFMTKTSLFGATDSAGAATAHASDRLNYESSDTEADKSTSEMMATTSEDDARSSALIKVDC